MTVQQLETRWDTMFILDSKKNLGCLHYCAFHVLVQTNFRRYYFYFLPDQAQILLDHFKRTIFTMGVYGEILYTLSDLKEIWHQSLSKTFQWSRWVWAWSGKNNIAKNLFALGHETHNTSEICVSSLANSADQDQAASETNSLIRAWPVSIIY